jgi:hypothetical protein
MAGPEAQTYLENREDDNRTDWHAHELEGACRENSPLCGVEARHGRFVLSNGLRNSSARIDGNRDRPALGGMILVGSEA